MQVNNKPDTEAAERLAGARVVDREAIAMAVAGYTDPEKWANWRDNHSTYPNRYKSEIDRVYAITDRVLSALAEPAGEVDPAACVACEDNPKGENNPCAVCGRTTPPASAIREAAETARACLAGLVSAGHNCPSPDPDQIEKAFWAIDAALAGSAE